MTTRCITLPFKRVIWLILVLSQASLILGCSANRDESCKPVKYTDLLYPWPGFQTYFDYEEGLRCAKSSNKPLLLFFTGHGIYGSREMDEMLAQSDTIRRIINHNFVFVMLYGDDKTVVDSEDYIISPDHDTLKRLGEINRYFQRNAFHRDYQPCFIIADHGFMALAEKSYDIHERNFLSFLDEGLKSFESREIASNTIKLDGNTLRTLILPPHGYTRVESPQNSFGDYLQSLPLKPEDSEVKLYNGASKANDEAYVAVVDLPIGGKDLHQCADAVMRLRAEHLWEQGQYDKIHFNFTNGFRVDYSEWMKGKRIVVEGNRTYWRLSAAASNTYEDFWKYMETIFTYAGTLSLSKELQSVNVDDMHIGDVFIRGGSPGHAVIVVDMAIDTISNKKLFLLAQSYMPAQEIQILANPNDAKLSPWYLLDIGTELVTPEWTFYRSELKRFED